MSNAIEKILLKEIIFFNFVATRKYLDDVEPS